MGSKGGSDKVTTRVQIPSFLQPFIQTQADIGQQALLGLAARLSGVPAADIAALGAPPPAPAPRPLIRGRFTERASLAQAMGSAPASLPSPGPARAPATPFPGAAPEDLVAGLTPAQRRALELGIARAQGAGGFIPAAQQEFLRTAQGRDIASFLDPTALSALQSTAAGDFLFGGQGFREAVDAAVRAAQPHILSTFGGAGRGTGGLAQTAIAQAASDAFAAQFGQERARQLQAASALSGLAEAERARQLQAAGLLPSMAFADTDALLRIGTIQQQQAQRELDAPIMALERLLTLSGAPVPLGATMGQVVTQPGGSSLAGGLAGGLGGALTGAQLGSLVPGIGTGLGAGLGAGIGLLGGLFG